MSNIPNIGFVSSITSGGDELPATFRRGGDIMSNGSLQEFLNRLQRLENRVVELEEANQEKDRVIEELRLEVREYAKSNKALRQQLDRELAKCADAEEKIRTLEKVGEEKEREIQIYKIAFETVVAENQKLHRILSQSGVKETNWWKVACLAVIAGVAIAGCAVGIVALSGATLVASGSLMISGGSISASGVVAISGGSALATGSSLLTGGSALATGSSLLTGSSAVATTGLYAATAVGAAMGGAMRVTKDDVCHSRHHIYK